MSREETYCVIIPTYNNSGSIIQVIDDVKSYCRDIIVVCDGSTDGTLDLLKKVDGIELVAYDINRGKGYALKKGFEVAKKRGFNYAVTLDSDGQHKAGDLHLFTEALREHPDSMIIGTRQFSNPNMPSQSTFANKFSNFWFTVQTGNVLSDTQTGYRLYPLRAMQTMRSITNRYEAELELLVRIAWKKIPIVPVAINVFYPEKEKRVSFFRPGKDFLRISILNTILCVLSILYGYPSMILRTIITKFKRK